MFDSNKRIRWKFIYYNLDNKNIVDTTKTLVTIRRKRLIDEMKTLCRETDILLVAKRINAIINIISFYDISLSD